MVWGMVAGATIGTVSSLYKSKAESEALLADSKLQRKRLNYIRKRQDEAYNENTANVEEAEMRNTVNIEKSRLQAESDSKVAMAGSGISGQSVDDLNTEVAVDVAEAHNANERGADKTLQGLFKSRLNSLEDLQFDIDGMPQFDAQAAVINAALSGASGALSQYSPSEDTGLKKKKKDSKQQGGTKQKKAAPKNSTSKTGAQLLTI